MLAAVWRVDRKRRLWRNGVPMKEPLLVVLMRDIGSLHNDGSSRYREMHRFKCEFWGVDLTGLETDWIGGLKAREG